MKENLNRIFYLKVVRSDCEQNVQVIQSNENKKKFSLKFSLAKSQIWDNNFIHKFIRTTIIFWAAPFRESALPNLPGNDLLLQFQKEKLNLPGDIWSHLERPIVLMYMQKVQIANQWLENLYDPTTSTLPS